MANLNTYRIDWYEDEDNFNFDVMKHTTFENVLDYARTVAEDEPEWSFEIYETDPEDIWNDVLIYSELEQ